MPLDLALLSLHHQNGQDLPGLLGVMPTRKAARGREREPFLISLSLSGNASFSAEEYRQLTNAAAAAFYNAPGALTTALRIAAEKVNQTLLDRNLATTGRGQYAIGALVVAALRDAQLTVLQCGPAHALHFRGATATRYHDPVRSGKGLGLQAALEQYYSQILLQPGDRLLFCPMRSVPPAIENTLTSDRGAHPIEEMHGRLLSLAEGDLSAALIHATEGRGLVTLVAPSAEPSYRHTSRPTPAPLHNQPAPGEAAPSRVSAPYPGAPSAPSLENLPRRAATETPSQPAPADGPKPTSPLDSLPRRASTVTPSQPAPTQPASASPAPIAPEPSSIPAHIVGRPPVDQPSAYAIPPQASPEEEEALVEELAEMALQRENDLPTSIPRLPSIEAEPEPTVAQEAPVTTRPPRGPRAPSEGTRRAAQFAVNGMQAWRSMSARLGDGLRRFLPRLLPGTESESAAPASGSMSGAVQAFIAVAVPIMVAVVALVVYVNLGLSASYEQHLNNAVQMSQQARGATDPVSRREAWTNVLMLVDQARVANGQEDTPETSALRQEALANLDILKGVARLNFKAAFDNLNIQVSRMAASESDLYMLDADSGRILRAAITNRGYELDYSFKCDPGDNSGTEIGPMVDLLIPPKLNFHSATVIGVDALGHLLYCAPGQVAHPETLSRPNAKWDRVTAMALDGLKLYILDATSSSAWVYNSKENTITFPDVPYFYFGSQIPAISDAIDMTVSGDSMYLLHSDGRLTHCIFGRGELVPTRCDSPVPLANRLFPAYGATDPFGLAHFTQIAFAPPPETALLLLDDGGRQAYRVNLQSFELQGIFGASGPAIEIAPSGPFTAMAVGPNHVLYLALGNQVYYSIDMP